MRALTIAIGSCLWLVACYSPELRDCTVTCSAPDECADDQVCAEGLCRAPRATCEGGPPPPANMVALHVNIMGEGAVVADTLTCSTHDSSGSGNQDDDDGDCMWMIPIDTPVELVATVLDDKPFERWTTPNCAGEDVSCVVTAAMPTMVGVKFK